jgi:hypothetical protein
VRFDGAAQRARAICQIEGTVKQARQTGKPITAPSSRSASAAPTNRSSASQQRASNARRLIVFVSLLGVLGLTTVLLLAMSPAPLNNEDAARSLFAIDAPPSLNVLFDTQVPLQPHWQYIYIHQSKTLGGDVSSLARDAGLGDHFVVGNGDGCIDGEIQISQRWNQQLPAQPPPGTQSVNERCISICMVGDFNETAPTPTQVRRLGQLVQTLQNRCHIPADGVLVVANDPRSPAGMGRYFPITAFKDQLLSGLALSN